MEITAALLADAATVAEGKLFVHGAGWDTINTAAVPARHPLLAVAVVFKLRYDEALTDIPFEVTLLDEDDHPLGPKVAGELRAGHGPDMAPGAPILAPLALPFAGLQFPREGGYRFRIKSGDTELASISFRIRVRRLPG